MIRLMIVACLVLSLVACGHTANHKTIQHSASQHMSRQEYILEHNSDIAHHTPYVVETVKCTKTSRVYIYRCSYRYSKSICLVTYIYKDYIQRAPFNAHWNCNQPDFPLSQVPVYSGLLPVL